MRVADEFSTLQNESENGKCRYQPGKHPPTSAERSKGQPSSRGLTYVFQMGRPSKPIQSWKGRGGWGGWEGWEWWERERGEGDKLRDELEVLHVCDLHFIAPRFLTYLSVGYLRGIHSPLSMSAYALLQLPANASVCARRNLRRSSQQ